jgi:hypothetical protein
MCFRQFPTDGDGGGARRGMVPAFKLRMPQIPFNRPEAQADVDTIAAMEGNQKHNGPLENKWRATE